MDIVRDPLRYDVRVGIGFLFPFIMLERKTSLYDMTDVMDLGGDPLAESVYETAAAVPAETVTEEGENAVIIWIGVAAVSTAAIVVILLNRKKFFGKFL